MNYSETFIKRTPTGPSQVSPNTIYFSVCLRLTEVSAETGILYKGKYKTLIWGPGLVCV